MARIDRAPVGASAAMPSSVVGCACRVPARTSAPGVGEAQPRLERRGQFAGDPHQRRPPHLVVPAAQVGHLVGRRLARQDADEEWPEVVVALGRSEGEQENGGRGLVRSDRDPSVALSATAC